MALIGQALPATAKGKTARHLCMGDGVTYSLPDQDQGFRRVDAAQVLLPLATEVMGLVDEQYQRARVRVKNTSVSSWAAGTLLAPHTGGLTSIVTATAVNNPQAGSSVAINVTGAYEAGMLVFVTTVGVGALPTITDTAIVTVGGGGGTIYVDKLFHNHTLPVVTADVAWKASKANATGGVLAEWVTIGAIPAGAYGEAWGFYELTGLDTSAFSAGDRLYLSTTDGLYTGTAPTAGLANAIQMVGAVKKVHASTGIIKFMPGSKRVLSLPGAVPLSTISGGLLIGPGSSGIFAETAMSGDATINSSGALTIANSAVTNAKIAANTIDLTAKVTGILPGANGGSGNGFFAVSGPATSLKTFTLPNASATILTSNAVVSVAQGGTGLAAGTSGGILGYTGTGTLASSGLLTANGLLIGGGAGATPSALAAMTDGQIIAGKTSNAPQVVTLSGDATISNTGGLTIANLAVTNAKIAASTIDLTAKVTGILPGANGGSGNGFFAVSGPATSLKTFTLPNASATILTSNAVVTVAQGGTGTTALTTGSIVFAGASGVYSQNNSGLFWDDSNQRLGLGSATPSYHIDIFKTIVGGVTTSVRNTNNNSGAYALMGLGNDTGPGVGQLYVGSSNNTTYGGGSDFAVLANVGDLSIRTLAAKPITFYNNNTLTMSLSNAGDLSIMTVGAGLKLKTGSNAKAGTVTLTGTTNVVVSTTAVGANSRIIYIPQDNAGTIGICQLVSRVAGTSFTLKSSTADTRLVYWFIIEDA